MSRYAEQWESWDHPEPEPVSKARERNLAMLRDCLAHLATLEPAGMGAKVIACPKCGENMVQKIGAHTGKFILAHCRIYIAKDTRELAVAELNKAG